MTTVYRAHCVDPLCKWESPTVWSAENNAYADLNDHIQMEHTSQTGVRAEVI